MTRHGWIFQSIRECPERPRSLVQGRPSPGRSPNHGLRLSESPEKKNYQNILILLAPVANRPSSATFAKPPVKPGRTDSELISATTQKHTHQSHGFAVTFRFFLSSGIHTAVYAELPIKGNEYEAE